VLLAGNPNSGKTTVFNGLTGGHEHVGNYPGCTVEKRTGHYLHAGRSFLVTDLPGAYGLTSYSPEETITRDAILKGGAAVVVVVVDATALRRSLVFLAQVLEAGANAVLCLNMSDEAHQAGQRLNLPEMERLLGIPVVETVGRQPRSLDVLREAVAKAATRAAGPSRVVLGVRQERAVRQVCDLLLKAQSGQISRWRAIQVLLDDPAAVAEFSEGTPGAALTLRAVARVRAALERETGQQADLLMTAAWYGFVDGLLREVTVSGVRPDARAVSDALDLVVAHPLLGLPFFLAAMYGVFWVTFSLGDYPMQWLDSGIGFLASAIAGAWPEATLPVLRSLVLDGIIGGVGGVLVFLPNIALLFLGLSFLEDSGYMARGAFLLDRFMHRFGLHGKSFIPMVTGLGCSIPGIMGTRILENERDRLTTMLVLPLMSCGARLPIWMLLIPAFCPPPWRAAALWLVYFFGAFLALLLALLLRRTLLRGDEAPFVMELPPYRLPTWRGAVQKVIERSWLYLRKAGTVILGISILLWVATTWPQPRHYRVDAEIPRGEVVVTDGLQAANLPDGVVALTPGEVAHRRAAEALECSVAGRVGRILEPLLSPLGFDWKLSVALVGALAAKEVFVSQMGVVYALGEGEPEREHLRERIARDYPASTGVALILFLLIATPCMATLAVTRRESGRWSFAFLQFFGLTAIGYGVAAAARFLIEALS